MSDNAPNGAASNAVIVRDLAGLTYAITDAGGTTTLVDQPPIPQARIPLAMFLDQVRRAVRDAGAPEVKR